MYYRSVTSGPRAHRAVVAGPAPLHCKIAGRGVGIAVPKLLGCHGVAIRSCAVVFKGSRMSVMIDDCEKQDYRPVP